MVSCEDQTLEIAPTNSNWTVERLYVEVESRLGIPKEEYCLHDIYGPVTGTDDLARAMQMAGHSDCILQVVYHPVFAKLQSLQKQVESLQTKSRLQEVEIQEVKQSPPAWFAQRQEEVKEGLKEQLKKMINDINRMIDVKVNQTDQTVSGLCRDRSSMQMEVQTLSTFLKGLDIAELQDLMANAKAGQARVTEALSRVVDLERSWSVEKDMMNNDIEDVKKDLQIVQTKMVGKIQVCIEAGADLTKETRLVSEKATLVERDVDLLQEELKKVATQSLGLRTLISGAREDSAKILTDSNDLKERVHCLEGAVPGASRPNSATGVVFCRRFHPAAKGADVQFNTERSVATGRGFSALRGVVVGNNEGLVIGDGPCRRTANLSSISKYVSYFEVELTEAYANTEGCGGLYVGASCQSAEQVLEHPLHEYDGWLVGGKRQALLHIRRPTGNSFSSILPAAEACEVRSLDSEWNSEEVKVGDRVGVLMMIKRQGGIVMRIIVNRTVAATQIFQDAPPEHECPYLTPLVRIAGTAKSVKICPGMDPPKFAMEGL
jgi:hypothetical protein